VERGGDGRVMGSGGGGGGGGGGRSLWELVLHEQTGQSFLGNYNITDVRYGTLRTTPPSPMPALSCSSPSGVSTRCLISV